MANPIIHGAGPNLETGNSCFIWIVGENLEKLPGKQKEVTITSAGGKIWEGKIIGNIRTNPTTGRQTARVRLDCTTNTVTDEDLAVITVTVTNSTGSANDQEEAVIDGP